MLITAGLRCSLSGCCEVTAAVQKLTRAVCIPQVRIEMEARAATCDTLARNMDAAHLETEQLLASQAGTLSLACNASPPDAPGHACTSPWPCTLTIQADGSEAANRHNVILLLGKDAAAGMRTTHLST